MTVPRSQQGRIRAGTLAGSITLFMAFSGLCLLLTVVPGAGICSRSRIWAGPWGSIPAEQQAGIILQRGVILSWVTSQPVSWMLTQQSVLGLAFLELLFCKSTLARLCLEPLHGSQPICSSQSLEPQSDFSVTSCSRPMCLTTRPLWDPCEQR